MNFRKNTSYILLIILFFYINMGNFVAYALSPNDIWNKVFFLDSQDTDNDQDNSNEPNDETSLTILTDKFNSNNWFQINSDKKPLYKINTINSHPSLYFDWTNDLLNLKDNKNISLWLDFTEKSYAMVIKTSDDVETFQTIYDEATKEKWFSFQIENWHLYAGTFNTLKWSISNQTIDLWEISNNEIYTIIFIYSSTWDFIEAYLNWKLKWTLNNIEIQNTHWACTFETSFNCNLYTTDWTLSLWSTKNDILKLSDWTISKGFEKSFFKWYIWEISSYNHALTSSEIEWLYEYLILKWWIDIIAPEIDNINFNSWAILPWWNHNIIINYSDSWTWATWIDDSTANPYLEKWDSWNSSWDNITNSALNSETIDNNSATYSTQDLDYWKYRFNFNIKDNYWNISLNKEITFYIDKPELNISTWSINIWELNSDTNTFWDTITVTVKTIWAWFKVKLKKNENLKLDSWEIIPYYDWVIWMWYDKNDNWSLSDYNDDILMEETKDINTDWKLSTYTYTLKIWAIIEKQQAGWNYNWKVDFEINLDY